MVQIYKAIFLSYTSYSFINSFKSSQHMLKVQLDYKPQMSQKSISKWQSLQSRRYFFYMLIKYRECSPKFKIQSKAMAWFIGTKQPTQCYTFHRRKLNKHKKLPEILLAYFYDDWVREIPIEHLMTELIHFLKQRVDKAELRQQLIRQVQNNINTIFEGGYEQIMKLYEQSHEQNSSLGVLELPTTNMQLLQQQVASKPSNLMDFEHQEHFQNFGWL